LVLALGVAAGAAWLTAVQEPAVPRVGLVLLDEGEYGTALVSEVKGIPELDVVELDEQSALRELGAGRLEAVIVIAADYSAQLRAGSYQSILRLYSAHSSRAAATVSEPFINQTILFFATEFVANQVAQALASSGDALSAAEQAAMRQSFAAVWSGGGEIVVQQVSSDGPALAPEPADTPYSAAMRWYSVLVVGYLLSALSFVMDARASRLLNRVRARGVAHVSVVTAALAAPVALSAAGFVVICVVAAVTGMSLASVLTGLLAGLIYTVGVAGVALAVAAVSRSMTTVLLLSGLICVLQALLGEVFFPLPDWATTLSMLSQAIPAHWLQVALTNGISSYPGALLAAMIWVVIGVFAAAVFKEES
jgi:hypothetical protein